MIEGLVVKDLTVHQDDRGWIYEMVHDYELPDESKKISSQFEKEGILPPLKRFGQVYVVNNPVRGTIRAFHCHDRLWDFFTVVKGVVKFCFVDDRKGHVRTAQTARPDPGENSVVVVSSGVPKLIVVPPGIYHGWKSLTDDCILVSVGSEVYDRKYPDEHRVKPDRFNQEFGYDPWIEVGR